MNPTENFTDEQVIARTLWGEARSEGGQGMHAVGNVIANRAKNKGWWARPYDGLTDFSTICRNVCLYPFQFSCWNRDDPNRTQLFLVDDSDSNYVLALTLTHQLLTDQLPDITGGAHYYYADYIETPSWAIGRKPSTTIGRQIFYV